MATIWASLNRPFFILQSSGSESYAFLYSQLALDLGKHTPDVVLQTPQGELLVEVAVTHFIDAHKLARLLELGLSAIEIDLSRMARTLAGEELEHLLVHDVETKRWALKLPLATWAAQRQRQFEEEARPYFWELERRRLAAEQARKKEEQARRRETLYQVALAEARKGELKPVIEWHIAHLSSSSQIISCPRPVRNRGGQAFSNVELDCQRCRYYRGHEANWYIRCAHDRALLIK